MLLALQQAQKAYNFGEIPIGAVIVYNNQVIASAYNEKEMRADATYHAEILAIQRATVNLGTWRLTGSTLYSTLEPCPMCAGAMLNSRISRLVFAARDAKAGAAGTVIDLVRYPGLNHQLEVEFGVCEKESAELLSKFFNSLRRDGRDGRRRSTRNRVGG